MCIECMKFIQLVEVLSLIHFNVYMLMLWFLSVEILLIMIHLHCFQKQKKIEIKPRKKLSRNIYLVYAVIPRHCQLVSANLCEILEAHYILT